MGKYTAHAWSARYMKNCSSRRYHCHVRCKQSAAVQFLATEVSSAVVVAILKSQGIFSIRYKVGQCTETIQTTWEKPPGD